MKNLNLLILKEMLDYNKDTGIFTWKIDRSSLAKKGIKAGSISSDNYVLLTLFNKQYKAHRIAWLFVNGSMPTNHIDHINGNKQDNRIDNLRLVTHSENSKNLSIDKRNKSGKTGVCWHVLSKKWIASISIDKKLKHLGYFDNIEDAILARKNAEITYNFHLNHGRDKIIY
jgi:hypothetical protein